MDNKNPAQGGARSNANQQAHYTYPPLKLPPFGASLALLRPQDHRHECLLFIGDDSKNWEQAKHRHQLGKPVILLPDPYPERYQWPVHGWEVLVFQNGMFPFLTLPILGHHLLSQGAVKVRVLRQYQGKLEFVVYGGSKPSSQEVAS